jgi:hypothetical protein
LDEGAERVDGVLVWARAAVPVAGWAGGGCLARQAS